MQYDCIRDPVFHPWLRFMGIFGMQMGVVMCMPVLRQLIDDQKGVDMVAGTTPAHRKMMQRRAEVSRLMADHADRGSIAAKTGVSLSTVKKDIKWVLGNPDDVEGIGGVPADGETVDWYTNGVAVHHTAEADDESKGARGDTDSTSSDDKGGIESATPIGNDDEPSPDGGYSVGHVIMVPDVDDTTGTSSVGTMDAVDDQSGSHDDGPTGTPGSPTVESHAMDDDGVGDDGTREPVDDSMGDGVVNTTMLRSEQVGTDSSDGGGAVDINGSSTVIIGMQSDNGIISVGSAPVRTVRDVVEVEHLDTPDSIDAGLRERLDDVDDMLTLERDADDSDLTHRAKTITNVIMYGVDNPDDLEHRESLWTAITRVVHEYFSHGDPDDLTVLGLNVAEWDDDVELTPEEQQYKEYMYAGWRLEAYRRRRQDRVSIAFEGFLLVMSVLVAMLGVFFMLVG